MACESGYAIRVLMNDWMVDGPWELEAEHGLSFYVETPESKFLFDCGHTGAAWRNAEKMGVNLSAVEFVALSHSHYDHAGGFPSLLEYVKPKVLYFNLCHCSTDKCHKSCARPADLEAFAGGLTIQAETEGFLTAECRP